MREKIITTKVWLIFSLLGGILNLLVYTESFGNHNNYPEFWLIGAILYFCMVIILGVKLEILRNK